LAEKPTSDAPIDTVRLVAHPTAVPAAPTPQSAAVPDTTAVSRLVPGWWLAIAAALGSASTLAGALLLR